jgi:hypothetical protein
MESKIVNRRNTQDVLLENEGYQVVAALRLIAMQSRNVHLESVHTMPQWVFVNVLDCQHLIRSVTLHVELQVFKCLLIHYLEN